jgi:hypothetical protein
MVYMSPYTYFDMSDKKGRGGENKGLPSLSLSSRLPHCLSKADLRISRGPEGLWYGV